MKDLLTQKLSKILHLIPIPSLAHWICGLIVVLSTFAYSLTGQLTIREILPRHTVFYGLCATFALSIFSKYNKTANKSLKILAGIISFIFSQFITIDGSFYHVHNWSLCFGSSSSCLIWIIRSSIYTYVLYKILLGILNLVEGYHSSKSNYQFDIKRWFVAFVFIRLIVLALFYPCVFGFDAAVGLRTFLDPDCATCNHHPYFVQFIHAFFFNLGKGLGHKSVGFAILSLISVLFSSSIIVYGLKLLERAELSKKWLIAIGIIYALFPLYPYLSISPTKDGLFAYSFLLYIFTLYELYLSQGNCLQKIRFMMLHGLAILLVCLTRHQGIYISIFEVLLLIILYRHLWSKILLATIPSLCIVMAYNKVLLPYNNVEPGGKQEVYGMLFQQTAYYLKCYPKDITPEERQFINQILNTDTIVSKYAFDKTDAVKNGYKYNPWYRIFDGTPSMFRHIDHTNESEDLKQYRSAWLSMGLRHPLSYIEASLSISAGFFYNFNKLILETDTNWSESPTATTPEYHFTRFKTAARIYKNHIYSCFKYPIVNWIIAIPYYNWTTIFFIALLFYRKDWKGLAVFLPVLLSLGILLICPMIYGRYSYPIVIGLPLLVAYVFSTRKELKANNVWSTNHF